MIIGGVELSTALCDMRAGDTIRRAGCSKHYDIYDFPNEPVGITVRDVQTGEVAMVASFSVEDVFATDWEIVPESEIWP